MRRERVHQFPSAAITELPSTGGLKQHKFILSQRGGLTSTIERSVGVVPSEGREGASVTGLSPSFGWPQAFLGLSMALSPCLHIIFPVCVCPNAPLFIYIDTNQTGLGLPTLMASSSLNCKDLFPNKVPTG